jgi:pimeloyl-ACP methyl ester carboxylesterase
MELSSEFKSHGWTVKYSLSDRPDNRNGEVRTIVFVHGTPWSSVVFQPIVRALLSRSQYRILLYDLPGYGQSQQYHSDGQSQQSESPFEGDTSVRTQGAVLADLLRHLQLDGTNGNEPPHIIAHDIAGAIALRTHLIHKCEFTSLLLMDTNTVLPWGDGFYKLARSKPDAFLELPSGIFDAVVRAVIKSACHNPKVLVPGWEDALAEPWVAETGEDKAISSQKQTSFVRQIAQANDADVAEMLDANMYPNVRCDVKILWGEQDQWIPREKMERLSEMLGDRSKDFVAIPEAGHLIMLDQPERVAFEVYDWLSRYR